VHHVCSLPAQRQVLFDDAPLRVTLKGDALATPVHGSKGERWLAEEIFKQTIQELVKGIIFYLCKTL